jgi:N-carbamoyl-L-amino-acid hydrolase
LNRREFNKFALGTLGAWTVAPSALWSQPQPIINGKRLLAHLTALAEFGKNPQGGVSRVAYSDADVEGRDYVMGLMRAARLDVQIDPAGNIVGRRGGLESSLLPLSLGSHIDTVPEGGNYDGTLGSLGAIEVAETLAEAELVTRHPVEVIIFQNEEGGKTGSRALIGEITEKQLDLVTQSGKTVREGIRFIGGDPDRLEAAKRRLGDMAAFVELHIEQGAHLDTEKIDIGVVEGIVSIKRWTVTIDGAANHAGTTPMANRRDALLAAARFIETVNRVVTSIPGRQVGTVGQIQAIPGAPNVIPGRVVCSLEIRDLDMGKVDQVFEEIRAEGLKIGRKSGATFGFDEFYVSEGAPTDERLQKLVADSATKLGLTIRNMPSGAGHDAQSIAKLCPVGMIFIPSQDGISHSPKEYSAPKDIVNGVNVLLHTLLGMDTAF